MKISIKQYFSTFYHFTKKKLFLLLMVAVVSSAFEGLMLILLVPFLYIARSMAGSLPIDIPLELNFMEWFANKKYALILLLCVFIAVSIAQEYLKRYQTILTTLIKAGFNKSLSTRLYKAFAEAKWSFLLSKRRSDIANALSNELKMIDVGTQILLQFVTMVPLLAVQLVICTAISPEGTLAAVIIGTLFFLFLRPINKRLGNFSKSINDLLKDSLSDVHEHLNGIKEVKSYGAEEEHVERFSKKIEGQMSNYTDFVKLFTRSSFIYNSGTFVLAAVFVFLALTVFNEGLMRLIILFVVFLRVWPIFSGFQMSAQMLMLMFPAWESFADSLNGLEKEREKFFEENGVSSPALKKGIELANVSFSYP